MEKESLFNVYIRVKENKQIILALNRLDLETIFNGIKANDEYVRIDGRKIFINHDTLKIFDVSKAFNKNDKGILKDEARKWTNTLKLSGMALLKHLGIEVTHNFQIPNPLELESKERPMNKNTGKIFISHSVKDDAISRDFTERILQIGLGVNPKTEVFNISVEDSGIKTGEDFKNRIEKELIGAKAVILLITENYKKSEACLNEMGAAWILGVPVIPFILEPITYSSVGFIHNPTQLAKLNSKTDLKSFVAANKNKLFSSDYDDSKLDRKIEEFIQTLSTKKSKNKTRTEPTMAKIGKLLVESNSNPFYKINQHASTYYLKNKKYCEIPDTLTSFFLGIHDFQMQPNKVSLTKEELKKKIGNPLESIMTAQYLNSSDNGMVWLIYDNTRHHIATTDTYNFITKAISHSKKVIDFKTVPNSEIKKYIQGDAVNFSKLIHR